MKRTIVALGLAGDGDDSDIIRNLEHSFGICFGPGPLDWTTVGDIENDLLALYPATETPGVCASAMAFRRLRAVLPAERWIMRPATPLARIIKRGTARGLARAFRCEGLDVPLSQLDRSASMGCLMVIVGLFMGLCLCLPLGLYRLGPLAVALTSGGILLVVRDRGDPADTTLGALAKDTAARNFAAFAARGADRRVGAIRAALRRIVCAEAGIDPRTVGCETRLFG